ncbi:SDR family oxidoreductase [uncultured Sphingomonas sp.]|uniref:SDR family oxidoreductase n=1 Tax=uncultured Sphingomonas sp. TaxID=158754 RepID=UPI0035CC9742
MATQTRAAIVTGSSQGIGAAVAERLAADGLAVVINYSSKSEPAEALVEKIERAGGRAIAVRADVSDPAAVAQLFDDAAKAFGGVDVLVNNAGIMKLAPMAETTDELFDQTIAINLKGVFNGLREAAKRLREGGRIVSFSSSVVGLYQPTYAAYAATKAGIEAMSHILSKELGPKKITVNVIAPGPVATKLFLDGKSDDEIKPIVARTPLGRLGEPDDIAGAVSLLASEDGGWINGQVLRVNGGII